MVYLVALTARSVSQTITCEMSEGMASVAAYYFTGNAQLSRNLAARHNSPQYATAQHATVRYRTAVHSMTRQSLP